MSITCTCGAEYATWQAICDDCGQPLDPSLAPNQTPIDIPVAVPVPAPANQVVVPVAAVAVNMVTLLVPIDPDTDQELSTLALVLPNSPFDYLMGRADANEAIQPELHVERIWRSLIKLPEGFMLSRKTALVVRDDAGLVHLKVHPDASSTITYHQAGETRFTPLKGDDEVVLEIGMTLRMGVDADFIDVVVR